MKPLHTHSETADQANLEPTENGQQVHRLKSKVSPGVFLVAMQMGIQFRTSILVILIAHRN